MMKHEYKNLFLRDFECVIRVKQGIKGWYVKTNTYNVLFALFHFYCVMNIAFFDHAMVLFIRIVTIIYKINVQ